MKKKKNKWICPQHKFMRNLIYMLVYPFAKLKYHIKIKKQKNVEQCLILSNHQTAFDQFFISFAFKQHVYYVASEDLFSMGWVSRFIKWAVAPIPIKKQTTDLKAVKDCLRVAKEGGTIAIFPEGNRTFSGKTETIKKSIVKLIKALKLPIAFFKIEGGYGVQPRWSDVVRKGKMRGYVSRVITPEEIATLTEEELLKTIEDGLYVNEAVKDAEFKHKKSAEYLERAAYVCPFCDLSEFESHGDVVECKKCGKKFRYLPTKQLEGIGFESPFEFFADWYEYQENFVNKLDVLQYCEKPMYCDTAAFFEVIPYDKKVKLSNQIRLSLFGDRIEVKNGTENLVFSFDEIGAVTVLGRNKLNIYHGGKIYQIKSGKRFNALKYVNIYHRYKNLKAEDKELTFLGL